MFRHFLIPLLLSLPLAAPALADGKIFVPLPDMSDIGRDPVAADLLLRDLYRAMVLSQNCPGASLSGEEHSLISDGFDLLAYGALNLSTDEVISRYEKPAFDLVDQPGGCDNEAGLKADVLAVLQQAGGSLTALPDQERGYQDWRALMDQIRP